MKYNTPELAITMFDSDIGTESMSRINGNGNAATQALEKGTNSNTGVDVQVFKFKWE